MGDFQERNRDTSVNTNTLSFGSKDFRVIRFLLRLLSLWRPRSAGFFESYVYPVFVNLLLFTTGPIRNCVRATGESTWLSIKALFIVHEIGVWLGHILGNRYFASRDLETNALKPLRPLDGIKKYLNRRLKILNAAAVISMTFFSIMLCTLFVLTRLLWHNGDERFSAQLPHVHGPIDHILYVSTIFSIIYDLGVGLALSWTLALLYSCYAVRLKILENTFLKWKHASVDAVSLFEQVYAQPVKKSWKRIAWWFLAHNIVALPIPLYGYKLAQAFQNDVHHSKHLPQFICYLVFIVTIWLAPIVMGEQIKRRERKFMEKINEISPFLLEVQNREMHSGPTSRGYSDGEGGRDTFAERVGDSLAVTDNNDMPHDTSEVGNREMHSRPTTSRGYSDGDCAGDTFAERVGDMLTVPATDNNDSPNNPSQISHNGSNLTEGSDNAPKYTFVYRGKKLRYFLEYLDGRRLGVVARGYSIQLNISLISLIGAAISFLFELQKTNSPNAVCNCTMS